MNNEDENKKIPELDETFNDSEFVTEKNLDSHLDSQEQGDFTQALNRSDLRIQQKQKKDNRVFKKRYIVIIIILALIISVGVICYNYFKDYSGDGVSQTVEVSIPQGATDHQVAEILKDKGVTASVGSFILAKNKNKGVSISYGNYNLHEKSSADSALRQLVNPSSQVSDQVTIPEGKTVKEVLDILVEKTSYSRSQLEEGLKEAETSDLPSEANGEIEGWLFPNTYQFNPDQDSSALFKLMIDQTKSVLNKLGVPSSDQEEIIIKASIAQREVLSSKDMAKVARVIDNRLDKGIKLEMDTIIAYGATNKQGGTSLEMTQAELDDANNPYNSRIYEGLPPTPISNPGEEAIAGAVDPAEGDWLYFCTVDPDNGTTEFYDNEEDFNQGVAKYKAWLANSGE
ncbi:MAG: endolytic transglycosylase MltG [Candidatus Ancillula sp.]|nr:endolytic transglycosylase MltG [Candidatus Ancillula sp.]